MSEEKEKMIKQFENTSLEEFKQIIKESINTSKDWDKLAKTLFNGWIIAQNKSKKS